MARASAKPPPNLRQRAEAWLARTPASIARLSAGKIESIVHELQVHQMELQIQNEELRRTQLELAHSRDRYTDLYEFAPVGYLTLEAGGTIREASLTAAIFLGTERGKLVGARLSHFVAAGSQDALFRHWRKAVSGEVNQTVELELRRTNPGGPTVVELRTVRRDDEPGGNAAWRAALIDITERKRAEIALARLNGELERRVAERTVSVQASMTAARESERVLEEYFSDAPLGLLRVAPGGKVERANQAMLRLLGRPAMEVIGSSIEAHYADRQDAAALLARLGRNETVRNHRSRLTPKIGPTVHVLIDANGLWRSDRLLYSRWFVRDISHRADLEREILAIAERERERFGHDLHDDLCQRLAAIEFSADSLARQYARTAPGAARAARGISQALCHAIEHSRDLARGLSPTMLFGPEGLVSALRDLARRSSRIFRRDCRFRCRVAQTINDPTLSIHLFRIVQEAVGNAIKHGKADRIDIELAGKGEDLILKVSDNGVGLPARPRPGKGMGLRIAHYRAGIINASLVVRREAGGGTAVICTACDALRRPCGDAA
ncbi:MAG: PAS domain-containing sensor histidine kinase [Opitutaceae bacterium]